MSDEREELILQLLQENRDDTRRVLIELGGLRERVAVLEQRQAASPPQSPTPGGAVAGGLGGGALVYGVLELLQRAGLFK